MGGYSVNVLDDFLDQFSRCQPLRMFISNRQHSANSQQPAVFFSQKNQSPAISQQYFPLITNQHQPSATSQTNRLQNSRSLNCMVPMIAWLRLLNCLQFSSSASLQHPFWPIIEFGANHRGSFFGSQNVSKFSIHHIFWLTFSKDSLGYVLYTQFL
jgi:hypothetical protein